jgi:heme A synthase
MDYDVIYEILMLIFGILAIFGNMLLLYCMWKGTPKYMKNNAVLIAYFVLVQLGSSITITIIVPRYVLGAPFLSRI